MAEHTVEDNRDDDGSEWYLVRPAELTGAAVIFLHWFDEAPNANRGQFLEEAMSLADSGVTSVLPQLTFPWHEPPTETDHDLAQIRAEMGRLRATHNRLSSLDGVDPSRVALVGHDFGAMHGMTLFGVVDLASAVLIAPTPRWSDWFLRFWPISSDRYDYMRALSVVDPISTVTGADCPILFQFGKEDFYIAPMTGLELVEAAPEPKEQISYQTDHEMISPDARADRTRFLIETLGLDKERMP